MGCLQVPPGRTQRNHGLRYHLPVPRSRIRNTDAERFGAILARIRLERGWTRQKLATRSGMSPQYVAIVEQGGNAPSLTTVLELWSAVAGATAFKSALRPPRPGVDRSRWCAARAWSRRGQRRRFE